MNLERIRKDFPLLQEQSHRKPIVYFDNACQTLRPTSVIQAIDEYYLKYSACGGRSMHHLGEEVTNRCDNSRAAVAKFLNASRKEEIIFTRNTTEGINLVSNSLDFQNGDVVLLSDKEHNSNFIPWQRLSKKQNIKICRVEYLSDGMFDLNGFKTALNERVKLVSLGFTSNLDGVKIPAEEIIKLAHRNGALVLLDAAQTAPRQKIDVHNLDVDFLAFSGHKILGPSGTGVLYGKYALLEKLEPFMVGGDTVAFSTYDSCQFLPPPAKFEAGLQDYAGIFGLAEAVNYLMRIGFDDIQKQETNLNEFITNGINDIPHLKIIGPADPKLRGGIVTFYLDGVDSHQVALMLDQMANIQIRSGQHCVHSWFNAHQIAGSARASLYFYNTIEEAEFFTQNLKKVLKVL